MVFSQYGDYFYLYILMLTCIPAVVLGLMQKKIKYYGMVATLFMIYLIVGINKQLMFLTAFIVIEIITIKLYEYIRKKTDNKYIYWLFLFLSMSPIIINKISPFTPMGAIGFIGISYLNFRTIQIIIEIYDQTITKVDILSTLYFILFFASLSSGPIDRSRRFEKDADNPPERSVYLNEYLIPGIQKIAMGILYKFVIAFLLNTYWMENIPHKISFLNGVNYMYAYTFYLFFDFAGYSLFAVGTSYIFGIKVMDNFDKPFLSKDLKEFWTRWHISLSRWFGDYIFSRFVMSSMRKKRFKKRVTASYVGHIITMLVMGFWHGLTWYYILYGIYHGVLLALTDMYQKNSTFYKKHKKEKWFGIVQGIITFHLVCFGLLIFSGYFA